MTLQPQPLSGTQVMVQTLVSRVGVPVLFFAIGYLVASLRRKD